MNAHFSRRLLCVSVAVAFLGMPMMSAYSQEAQLVTTLAKEITESLGRSAAEFGGETVAEQTARRLVTEAMESAGNAGGSIAKTQVERILATGREGLILDLRSLSGKSLPLLEDVTDQGLPSAINTLARPGISKGIESLGSTTLQRAALVGETRLPGVGLKLVQHYGEDGAKLVQELTEDQANSLIASLRPNAINALPQAERSKLLNALASRPDARVFNLDGLTGPLIVVASGTVIWHGIDVALAPDERVTEQPDGTIVLQKTSVGSRAVSTIPSAAKTLSRPFMWTGVTFAGGICLICAVILRRRQIPLRRRTRPE
jgi:hypothetical protein